MTANIPGVGSVIGAQTIIIHEVCCEVPSAELDFVYLTNGDLISKTFTPWTITNTQFDPLFSYDITYSAKF